MSSSTQVILLERVEKLGELGEIVNVKPGFARNFLLPQKKALRANKENIAYFEAQKKVIEEQNAEKRKEAEKLSKKIDGVKVTIIRQASEAGQLFGSVNTRDIAQALAAETKETITRAMIDLNQNIKTIGLFPVSVVLHPEVRVEVTINIARSEEEAKTQAETGRALIAESEKPVEEVAAEEPDAEEQAQTGEEQSDDSPEESKEEAKS
ncbi:MAG: 50S ribosomal protein L9 [Alphaproteobacteria bacterium]